MITRILVANRGEIARRVFATCRRLGIETVAVYSDADAGLPHVREADLSVRLPGDAPADTYLRGDLIVEAARHTGADAIHPGYGFLSENADFARSVQAAGLTWVGPEPDSMATMGSKIRSKVVMEAAGVPVLPNLTEDTATEGDLPLLVKASAGGGGRGMRVVRDLADLAAVVREASAEALSAFGDGTVFVEPYVERGRHVEVQVVGDRHGDVVVYGERDCSVQRRHQKVIEESPAPDIDASVVAALHAAAAAAARAIEYVGAGTVEFLYSPERERFYFLEMNTRLQVEHPVTEAVFGVDLVALQVAVAEGKQVPAANRSAGHAIEVRLYAEDPAYDWTPQSGRLSGFAIPHDDEFALAGHGVRLDSGFGAGDEVGTFYDAMLAKVIAWGPDRASAGRMLAGALARARVHGVTTNRDLLVQVLESEAFRSGKVSTDLLERRGFAALEPPGPPSRVALAAAALMLVAEADARRSVQRRIPVGWRNVTSAPQRIVLADGATEHVIEWWGGRDGVRIDGVRVLEASPARVVVEVAGVRSHWDGWIGPPDAAGERAVHVDGPLTSARLRALPRFVDPKQQIASGALVAPMPGSVVAVDVEVGATLKAGERILVLEAMKMQHAIKASADGTVTEIAVRLGQQVAAGDVLAVVGEVVSEGEA